MRAAELQCPLRRQGHPRRFSQNDLTDEAVYWSKVISDSTFSLVSLMEK